MEILALLSVQILYSASYPLSAELMKEIHPIYWSCLRSLLAASLFFGIQKFLKTPTLKTPLSKQWLLAFLGVASTQLTFLWGLADSHPTEAALAIASIPIWTYAVAMLLKKETFSFFKSLGILLGGLGVALLLFKPDVKLSLFGVTHCIPYAFYLVIANQELKKENPISLLSRLFLWGAIMLLMFASFTYTQGKIPLTLTENFSGLESQFSVLLFLIIGGTVLPYFLNAYAARKLDPSIIALGVLLQPVFTALIENLQYKIPLRASLYPSAGLIFIGVIVSTRKSKRLPGSLEKRKHSS